MPNVSAGVGSESTCAGAGAGRGRHWNDYPEQQWWCLATYQCGSSNGRGRFNTPAPWVDTAATCDVRSKDLAPVVDAASALPKLIIDTKRGVTNFRWMLVVCPENKAKHINNEYCLWLL